MATKQELLDEANEVINELLTIAEEFYPNYYSSMIVAQANDLIKKLNNE